MNIRPIDLQILVTQTTEIAKVQAQDNSQLANQQLAFNDQLHKEMEAKRKKVGGTEKTEGKVIVADAKTTESNIGKKNVKKKNKKEATKKQEKKQSADGLRGTNIDISS